MLSLDGCRAESRDYRPAAGSDSRCGRSARGLFEGGGLRRNHRDAGPERTLQTRRRVALTDAVPIREIHGLIDTGRHISKRISSRRSYDGIKHKPETTFGNVKADVLADKDPSFQGENFCRMIRRSAWSG